MTDHTKSAGEVEARKVAAIALCSQRIDNMCTGDENPADVDEWKLCGPDEEDRMLANAAIDAYLAKLTSTKAEPSRIAEIREREIKATSGPWTAWDHAGWYHPYVSVVDTDKKDIIAPGVPGDETAIGRTWGTRGKYEIETDNAEFIAHARDDIPYLLDHITAIEAENAERDLAKFGASDASCYAYPGETDAKLRDAFCNGSAWAVERIAVIEADRERLTKALEPFARYFDLNDCAERDDDNALEVPIRDLRRAHALVSPPSTSQSEGEG